MDTSFKSPQILAILSDYYDAIVPEGQYTVVPGSHSFKIIVHDYTNLYFNAVNSSGEKGLIFIFPDNYRHGDYDLEDPRLHENDCTESLCPGLLEVDENYEAPLDNYRIIVMKALQVIDDDDEGNLFYPPGHTVPHGEPLEVVKMSWT